MATSRSFFIVDDNDLTSIVYETRNLWFPNFVNDTQAYGGSVTAGIAGAKASFSWSGSAIEVQGIAGTVPGVGPPAVQFAVDGTVIQTTVAPNNGSTDLSFPFLLLENIKDGNHKLDINVLNATTEYPFALDFIVYLPSSGVAPTASQQVVTTFLPAATAPAQVSSSSSSSSSSTPVGAIVGGIVGGLAVLIAAGIAVWFLCFRRRRGNGQPYFYATRADPADILDSEHEEAKPYDVGAPSVVSPSTLQPGSQYQAPSQYSSHQAPSQYTSQYTASQQQATSPGLQSSFGGNVAHTVSGYSGAASSSSGLHLAGGAAAARNGSSPNQPYSKAAEAGMLSVQDEAAYEAPPPSYTAS